MADGNRITPEDLSLSTSTANRVATAEGDAIELDIRAVRENAERHAVLQALARADGNILKASELLGISRPTLYDLMNRLAIRQKSEST